EKQAGPSLPRLGEMRQSEGPDDHRHGHQPERALQPRGRAPEDGREPVQEVGEEQEEREADPLQEVLQEAAWMLGDDLPLPQHDDQAERPETERRPGRCPVALAPPLVDRDQRKRHVSPQADVPQNLYRNLQSHPPGPGPLRTVRRGVTNCTYRRGFLRENTVCGSQVRLWENFVRYELCLSARALALGPDAWRRKPEDEPFQGVE